MLSANLLKHKLWWFLRKLTKVISVIIDLMYWNLLKGKNKFSLNQKWCTHLKLFIFLRLSSSKNNLAVFFLLLISHFKKFLLKLKDNALAFTTNINGKELLINFLLRQDRNHGYCFVCWMIASMWDRLEIVRK